MSTIEGQNTVQPMDLTARRHPRIMYLLADNTRLMNQRFPCPVNGRNIVQHREERLELFRLFFDLRNAVTQAICVVGASSDVTKFNQYLA